MICFTFGSFRVRFATRALPTGPVTVSFTAPDTITRITDLWNTGGNDFDPDIEVDMRLLVDGSVSNDFDYKVLTVSGAVITTVEQTVTTEGSVLLNDVYARFIDNNGLETWPVAFMRVGDTAAAFVGGIIEEVIATSATLNNVSYKGDVVKFSVNAQAADSVLRVDEYDWYLSQRTDDPAKKYLTIAKEPETGGNSFSGTVRITPTPFAETKFGFSATADTVIPTATTRALFRGVEIYARRVSDQAIQRRDLLAPYLGF